jgi:hypothetical protein
MSSACSFAGCERRRLLALLGVFFSIRPCVVLLLRRLPLRLLFDFCAMKASSIEL